MTHGGGEHSIKMSALELSRFGCNDVLKVGRKRVTQSLNESVSDKAVCRIALATPRLLKITNIKDD